MSEDIKIPPSMPRWMAEHMRRYLDSNGADGHLWDSSKAGGPGPLPTLLLTTTGRRSGESQTLPLLYGKTPTGYVIIASKGGHPQHPGWFLNLEANPKVRLMVAAERFDAVARLATAEERPLLWSQMAAMYPPFVDYQAKTTREIPVVVIERKDG